jgi:hypothetical protein
MAISLDRVSLRDASAHPDAEGIKYFQQRILMNDSDPEGVE